VLVPDCFALSKLFDAYRAARQKTPDATKLDPKFKSVVNKQVRQLQLLMKGRFEQKEGTVGFSPHVFADNEVAPVEQKENDSAEHVSYDSEDDDYGSVSKGLPVFNKGVFGDGCSDRILFVGVGRSENIALLNVAPPGTIFMDIRKTTIPNSMKANFFNLRPEDKAKMENLKLVVSDVCVGIQESLSYWTTALDEAMSEYSDSRKAAPVVKYDDRVSRAFCVIDHFMKSPDYESFLGGSFKMFVDFNSPVWPKVCTFLRENKVLISHGEQRAHNGECTFTFYRETMKREPIKLKVVRLALTNYLQVKIHANQERIHSECMLTPRVTGLECGVPPIFTIDSTGIVGVEVEALPKAIPLVSMIFSVGASAFSAKVNTSFACFQLKLNEDVSDDEELDHSTRKHEHSNQLVLNNTSDDDDTESSSDDEDEDLAPKPPAAKKKAKAPPKKVAKNSASLFEA